MIHFAKGTLKQWHLEDMDKFLKIKMLINRTVIFRGGILMDSKKVDE